MNNTEFSQLVKTDPVIALACWLDKLCQDSTYRVFPSNINGVEALATNTVKESVYDYELDCVHYEGGCEGDGEYVEIVIALFNLRTQINDAFIRACGCYDSYNGTEWDADWQQVVPREVTRIEYFAP